MLPDYPIGTTAMKKPEKEFTSFWRDEAKEHLPLRGHIPGQSS
jgi:hypothetical protein